MKFVCLYLVIILIVVHIFVDSSTATRSVAAAVERQLNQNGYAVLDLKKKRLVLRDTVQKDNAMKKSRQYSVPDDDHQLQQSENYEKASYTNTNNGVQNPANRNEESLKHYDKAQMYDSAAAHQLEAAERNAMAAAKESDTIFRTVHKKVGYQPEEPLAANELSDDSNYNAYSEPSLEYRYTERTNVYDDYVVEPQEMTTGAATMTFNQRKQPESPNYDTNEYSDYSQMDNKESSSYQKINEFHENRKNSSSNGGSSKRGDPSKIIEATAELEKTVGTLFTILAKREKRLIDEMERFKSSLTKSVTFFTDSESTAVLKRKRRMLAKALRSFTKDDVDTLIARAKRATKDKDGPYRSCVFINVPVTKLEEEETGLNLREAYPHRANSGGINYDNQLYGHGGQSGQETFSINRQGMGQGTSDDSYVQNGGSGYANEYSGKYENADSWQNYNVNEQQREGYNKPSMEQSIDLNSIYWLKLPREYNEFIEEKVYDFLSGVSHSRRDILVIPLSQRYTTTEEVTDGFLKAVKVMPISRGAQYLKDVKKLRIRHLR